MVTTIHETNPEASPRSRKRLIRITVWLVASVAMLLVLASVTVAILLHSERFHRYILNKVQQGPAMRLGFEFSCRTLRCIFRILVWICTG